MNLIIYLIRNKTEHFTCATWWSNKHGWTSIGEATVFCEADDIANMNLPLDGEWVKFVEKSK